MVLKLYYDIEEEILRTLAKNQYGLLIISVKQTHLPNSSNIDSTLQECFTACRVLTPLF